jgi:hypothetical protein
MTGSSDDEIQRGSTIQQSGSQATVLSSIRQKSRRRVEIGDGFSLKA